MKFNKVFSELFSNEFSLESEYIKQNIPITVKHKKCGYKFNILHKVLVEIKAVFAQSAIHLL